jgi:hypothetical protein
VGGAPVPGEGEEAGHRGVRGEEGRVMEDGGPAAEDPAEAEEEEGRDAGKHLQEQAIREPRPDMGAGLRWLSERRATATGLQPERVEGLHAHVPVMNLIQGNLTQSV